MEKKEEFLARLRAIEERMAALVTEAASWNVEQIRNQPPITPAPIDLGRLIRANEWVEHGVLLAERAIRGR